MKKSLSNIILFCVLTMGMFTSSYAQSDVGFGQNSNNQGLIQIADQSQLADTLNLWGDVRNSGKYLVPRGTNLTDLISYARGPATRGGSEAWAKQKVEIYVSHFNQASNQYQSKSFKVKLNEPLPTAFKKYPLKNGDVITVKAKQKPTFRDYFTIIAPILSLGLTAFLTVDRINN